MAKRLLWFVALYAVGVATTLAAASVLRAVLPG
jgi:K+ transporter